MIFSIYSIPNQIGDAYAHRSAWHKVCWWSGWNLPSLAITAITFIIQLGLIIAAIPTFGASLSWIQPTDVIGFVAKIFAVPVSFLIVDSCGPQIVAASSAVAGESHLDCTSDRGFEFDQIKSTREFTLKNLFTDEFQFVTSHEIIKNGEVFEELPVTASINTFLNGIFGNMILLFAGFVIDFLLLFAPTPGEAGIKAVLKAGGKELTKTTAKAVGKFLFWFFLWFGVGSILTILDFAGVSFGLRDFEISDNILKKNSTEAISYHPWESFAIPLENTVKPQTAKIFATKPITSVG